MGLHFFTPAHIMPLLEIVRPSRVSVQVLVDALALAKMLKKTPIVVGNCRIRRQPHLLPYGAHRLSCVRCR